MRTVLIVVGMLVPCTARAFCYQGTGYDLADAMNKALDYMVCLHNEQNERLNEQAKLINQLGDEVGELRRKNDLLQMQLDSLQGLVRSHDALLEAKP